MNLTKKAKSNDLIYMWRFNERECFFTIPHHLLEKISNYSIKSNPLETGGTIVGVLKDNSLRAEVTDILKANKKSVSFHSFFERPSDKEDTQLVDLLKKFPEKVYLGEWHSHPGGLPEASQTDLQTLVKLARNTQVANNTPVLLIIGNSFSEEDVNVYMAEKSGKVWRASFVAKSRMFDSAIDSAK